MGKGEGSRKRESIVAAIKGRGNQGRRESGKREKGKNIGHFDKKKGQGTEGLTPTRKK